MKSLAAAFAALLVAISPAMGGDAFVVRIATASQLQQVRGGGYVLYIRHGATDVNQPDLAPQVDLGDCSTQRPLTADGRKQMAQIGAYLRQAAIPIGEVFVSPLCRARESAAAAFGERFTVEPLLMYSGNMTEREKAPVVARTRALIAQPVPAGTNRVLLAHAPNLMDVMSYFPTPEGSVVILKPSGEGGIEYVATIQPQNWTRLLE